MRPIVLDIATPADRMGARLYPIDGGECAAGVPAQPHRIALTGPFDQKRFHAKAFGAVQVCGESVQGIDDDLDVPGGEGTVAERPACHIQFGFGAARILAVERLRQPDAARSARGIGPGRRGKPGGRGRRSRIAFCILGQGFSPASGHHGDRRHGDGLHRAGQPLQRRHIGAGHSSRAGGDPSISVGRSRGRLDGPSQPLHRGPRLQQRLRDRQRDLGVAGN